MRLRWSLLLAGGALLAGCSGNDGSPSPSSSESEKATVGPVIGASHVLLPAPGADGVLLLTGPPEGVRDTGPMPLWQWDGDAWTEVEVSGPAPDARSFFAAAHDPVRDVVVVFGGESADGLSDETWEWDGRAWRRFEGSAPGARAAPSLTWDPAGARVVLHGGNGPESGPGADTWAWDGDAWTELADTGPAPARWPAAMASGVEGQLLVYGGHQVADEALPPALGDTWVFADGAWALNDQAGGPGPLVNAQAVAHPELGVLLAGGSDFDDENGDVWRWTGATWESYARDVLPPRQAFGLAYDEARGVVVLTGGVVAPGETARFQDVWEWSGSPRRARRAGR